MNDLTVQPLEAEPTPPVADATPDPAPIAADPPAEPSEPAPEPKEHGNKGQTPWFLKRIAEESAKREGADRRAQDAERRAQEALALLERAQQGQQPPADTRTPAPRQADPGPDFQTAVRSEAAKQRLYEDTVDVRNAGMREFGSSFHDALGTLTAIGATQDDFVADVLAVDKANAHTLLSKLAADPEQAANLVGMDSKRRIAELTRLSMNTSTAKTEPAPKPPAAPKQVSKAPPPAPPVEPSSSKTVDWRSDEASDDDFDKGFSEMMEKRKARR